MRFLFLCTLIGSMGCVGLVGEDYRTETTTPSVWASNDIKSGYASATNTTAMHETPAYLGCLSKYEGMPDAARICRQEMADRLTPGLPPCPPGYDAYAAYGYASYGSPYGYGAGMPCMLQPAPAVVVAKPK